MVGNVPLQKRRALALSILMIALAQTSYIGALQGWTFVERLPNDDANYSSNCGSATLGAGDPFHVDILNGSDLWAGTSTCPKSSILSAVENATSNDEIIVHAGRYHENITIDNKDGLIVRAATGERVVLDGTQSISEDFDATWTSPDADGIQEVTLPVDGWQLFLDWEEQVPARWPNAGFANDSVFNRSYWAGGTLTNTNNAYTNGWLQDAGPETGVHDGLNETINATGLDPVGAIAILNVGSFKSYSREITSWNASTGTFGYDVTPSWKTKHHAYFLEGKRELIDVDGEWWFNNTNNRLHYRPTTGDNANNLDLRVKVQPFAITIENSDDVTIQGIDFFGTTIDVNECDGCSFTNSTLEYPSTSRRGQGIADESEDDRFVTHFYRSTNTFVDRISITNTDGAAIEFHGAGGQSYNNVVNNSYFHAIDWSASDQKGLMTTIYEGGRDMTFSNNTVHLTGASSVLSIGDSPTVLYNEVWDVGHLQTDGAVVQLMQGEVQGSEIAYNWIHDISKYGIRFDAPINQISTGNNGSIHHNVIWNASGGIMAKGDYHNISNNTVFGERVDGKNNIIILHEQNTGNENSTTWNNAVDAIAAHRSNTIWDYPLEDNTHGMNWNGYIHQYANSLSVFDTHTCAILENKSLACWGNNGNGKLGLGNTTPQSTPQYVDVGTGRTVKSLATSGTHAAHTCAILDNGSVSCWGTNGHGQLGLGNETHQSTPQYVDIGTGRTAIQLTLGNDHTCALLDNKSVYCWGANDYRQLGINSTTSKSTVPVHVDLGTNRTVIEIQSAHLHTCVLLDNGSVMCWGYNYHGQMGLGNYTNTIDPPILIPLDSNREVTSIGIGKHHTCFTYDNGSLVCSGRNNNGQLGRGNTADTNSFIYVPNLQNLSIQSALGSYQSCVLLINGSVQCWGANSWGQLGDGSQTQRRSPSSVILPVGRKAVFVSMGHGHTCARLDNQSTACWGNNHHGQLGLGNNTDQSTPVIIPLLGNLATITVKDMLVDPDNDDFRPKWGSHLHRLDAGAYDAADNNPWDAGIEWNYTPSSNPNIGCTDSVAFNYQSNAVFDDGNCQFIKKDVSGGTGHLNQPIVPITFTESLSNINTGTWTSGVTNSSSVIQSDLPNHGTDIAIWPNGDIAIVYNRFLTTYSNKVLGLSVRSSSSWTHTILENNSDTGYYPSVAIDDSGALHISYLDNTNETLKYATNKSGSWVFSTLDNAKYTSSDSSNTDLQIDSKGDIHIIYRVEVSSKSAINHTTNAGGSWVSTTVTNTAKNSLWPSLALDGNDFVHISAYVASGDKNLAYITNSKGSWTYEIVESSNDVGKYSQIAVDSNDKIVIVYVKDDANDDIRWARGTSGSFSKSSLKNNVRASWLSLGIDSNDDIHVSSHDTNNKRIYHYTNASGSWVQKDANFGLSGKFAEMAIDDNDDIHISHADTSGYSDLKYARYKGTGKGVKIQPIFSISPDLPKGLNFNWKTGEISGSPSELSTNTTYTVWVNGSGRSDSTSVWINVEENMRSSVPGLTATVNSLISPITFDWYSSIWETRVTNSSALPAGNDNHAGRHTDSAVDSNGKTHIVSFDDSNDDLRYSTNAGGSWSSSIIVSTGDTGRHPSIVIDSNDLIHVIFVDNTNTRLMYINKSVSSSSWSSPYQIHGDARNNPTGLDLDDDDTLYVSWRRGDAAYYKQCFVRTKLTNSTSWDNVPGLVNFYSSGSGGGNENHWVRNSCDVAVDSNKKIHIVVNDNDKDLRYITNADGSWDAEDVQGSSSSSVDTGRFVKLAIDSQDYVHITYAEKLSTSDPRVYYEKKNPSTGSWSTREELSWNADYPSIAIDSHDYVHIVRTSTSAGDKLVYESNYGGGSVEYISSIHTSGSDYLEPSIVVDNNDDIHVTAGYGSNKRLVSGTVIGTGNGIKDDPGSWRPVISTISSCEVSPSLPQGLSVNNQRCTLSGTPTELASNQTYTVWANTSSGDSFSTNLWLRVVNLAPSISYNYNSFNLTNNNVMSPNAIPTNSGGPIPSRIIDVGSVGSYTTWGISNDTSIAMDSNGYMHISYRDSTNKTLLYATDKSGSWVTTEVDSEFGSGDQSSIALDSNNNVHIVHFESDEYRLRYTTNMSGSWVSSRIVATTSVLIGFTPSIALDSDDNIHVSYMQAESAYRIKYATNSSGSWVATTVSPTTTDCSLVSPNICHLAPNAFYTTTSIDLDSNDKPHISYTCAGTVSNADLCLTTNASGSWSYQTLDSSGNTGFDNSISIDSDNNLHISYYDATNGNLRYATNKSGSWVYSSIDQTGDVGQDTSLGIDSDNNVHISYYDKTNRDLKYATNSSGVWVNSTIDSNLDVGTGSSIFVESNDRVHISYQESVSSTDGNLRYVIVDNNNSNYGWSINSPLPEGLDFNENTGVISGTPTEALSQTQYTIWANNSGGSSSALINISIETDGPVISYSPSEYNLTKGTSMSSSATPSNTGGQTPTHEIWNSSSNSAWLSSAIDSNDFSHVSFYNSGDLYYSTDKSGSWVTIVVNNGGTSNVGQYNSIAVDSNDKIHISYWNATQTSLMYSTNSGGSWTHSMIDNVGYVGEWTSIAIDSNDKAHISYYEKFGTTSNENLKYATNIGGSWSISTLEHINRVGSQTSIAIDSNNGVHIAYYHESNKDLKYINNIAGTWVNSTIDSTGVVGGQPSIVVDVYDNVHISYRDVSNSQLKYASNETGSWQNQSIDNSANVGQHSHLVIDSDGHLHISYRDLDGSDSDILYATNQSGSWVYHRFSISNWVHQGSSIVVDSNDNVILTYFQNQKILKTITYTDDGYLGWSIAPDLPTGLNFNISTGEISGTPTIVSPRTNYTVTARNIGGNSSTNITITVNDIAPSISYSLNDINATLGVAISPHSGPTNSGGTVTSWAISPDPGSSFHFNTTNGIISGTPTALLLRTQYTIYGNNSGGSSVVVVNVTVNDVLPNITYSPDWSVITNNTAMTTMTPTNTGGDIPSAIIDSTGQVGEHSSMAIDSYGFKHISYFDNTNDDLKYATDKSGSWVTISVDTTGNVGAYTSIAIDSNDNVHISYFDSSNLDLKYATCSSGCTTASNWNKVSVDTAGDVGYFTSIAIDSNDAVHISHYDASNDDLEYATCSSGCTSASNWDKVTIDTTGNVGFYISIAIDSNDALHISYYDLTNDDLKYTTCSSGCTTASNWDDVSVDTTGNVGYFTSIAIDSNDAVHISYRDSTNDDLKYATCSSGCTTASNWNDIAVDTDNVGHYTSITIDSNDAVHISYYDLTNDDLKYATCSSGCTTASNWDIVSVDTTGDVGFYTSIAIDSSDNVHISYSSHPNEDLKYVLLDSSSNLYGYSITPALPDGLTLNIATGEISGTPTALSINTTYTITARNSGGASTFTITIAVIDQIPTSLSISPSENTTATNNSAISEIKITSNGAGEVVTWELEGDLPNGLTFTAANQTIWGTPTELMPTTQYTIWANNSGGSISDTLNITVNDEIPFSLIVVDENTVATNNTEISTIVISQNGPGEIVTWELEGTLPTGLTFTSTNQTIWGTPTELMATRQYTIWANNSGGSVFANLNITVNDVISQGITISPAENTTVTNNTAMNSITFTSIGPGEIVTWELVGTLPTGLSFTSANQTIWGTPTELMTTTPYTIWANNSGGSVFANLNITVNDAISQGITISPSENTTATNNTPILSIIFTSSGPGEIVTWELEGELPTGLTFTAANQTIWGTPTELMTATPYTIWANNTGGSVSAILNITVNDEISQGITISPTENTTVTNNSVMNSVTFTSSGPGEIVTWELEGTLPTGLTFTSANQTIWGTPTELMTTTPYTIWANNTGGSVSATINITVNDAISQGITISPTENTTVTNNTILSPITFSSNGVGEILTWELVGTLPIGLTFTSANQTIWGTPTELMTTTPYTIWANNTGGSVSAMLNITVIDAISQGITISPTENTTATNNTPILSIIFTSSGPGEIVTWELEGILPTGLTFTPANQTIWGTPTELMTTTPYTIWANNTGGSVSATLNITVNDQVPTNLTISPQNTIATNNTEISPIVISQNGPGEIVTWELVGSLPNGLTFTPSNQTIWGTPTELMTTTPYTIWANNSGGSVSAMLNITVNDEVPTTLSYSNPDILLTNNTAMTPHGPITTGPGVVVTWDIVGELPEGIIFNSTTGILSGTPTELMTTTQYTIWANNSGGSISTVINITVVDQLPSLTYPLISLDLVVNTINSEIPFEPSLSGPGEIISWEMVGELPSGMQFNTSTGVLSGIPTELWSTANYTIWANNTGGSNDFSFSLTVVDQVPNEIGYSDVNLTLTNNTAMSPEQPLITGPGTITSWVIIGELPDGISFNESTGEISGTPTELWPITPYTVWANNSGGSVFVEFNLSVIAIEPSISYNSSVLTLTVGVSMTPLESLSTGGVIASWEAYPELPDGISIDPVTGHISGTPTTLQSSQSYTIWANNTGGITTFELSISIIDIPASIDISPNSIVLTIGESMNPAQISVSGGQVIEWGIHPELPNGLLFDTTNLSITGIPSELISETLYTIWANNSGGSQTTSISITIIDIPPTIDYVDEHVFYSNVSEVLIEPIVGGGEILNYSIDFELANGLTFDYSNGSIVGIPIETLPRTQFNITVSNSGGTAVATLNITILPSLGCMDSLAENYDPIAIIDSGLCVYTDTDGDGVADINEIEGCTDLDAVNYMPTATDDDGSCVARLSVIYPEYSIVLIVGQNNVSIVPEVLGQTVETWSITPSLPKPLQFNYLVENGVLTAGKGSISGIPLQPQDLNNYTIVAIDEDTNQSVKISIYLQILEDTDGDGKPNVGTANWIEDLDDDDDGYLDSIEIDCNSDPENHLSVPELDSEGNCVKEGSGSVGEVPLPESPANLYYWCILPLAIILAVMFFSLMSRQRKQKEDDEESGLDEYGQPIELN